MFMCVCVVVHFFSTVHLHCNHSSVVTVSRQLETSFIANGSSLSEGKKIGFTVRYIFFHSIFFFLLLVRIRIKRLSKLTWVSRLLVSVHRRNTEKKVCLCVHCAFETRILLWAITEILRKVINIRKYCYSWSRRGVRKRDRVRKWWWKSFKCVTISKWPRNCKHRRAKLWSILNVVGHKHHGVYDLWVEAIWIYR